MANVGRKIAWKSCFAFRGCPGQIRNGQRHYHLCTVRSTSQQRLFPPCPSQQIQNRDFFQLPKLPSPTQLLSKEKKFSERKIVGYSVEEMYNIVADVDSYQEFLPWCKKSIVTLSTPDHLEAAMVIGFPPITESYTSNVTMKKPHLIKAQCRDGKLFVNMITTWKFGPGLPGNSKTCTLDFDIIFEFRSALHSKLATVFFDEIVKKMASAFLQQAESRYGKQSIRSQQIFHNTYS